jgi:hypothetical protein
MTATDGNAVIVFVMTTPEELAEVYLTALGAARVEWVLELFEPDGIVYSPLYGPVAASDFYPALFADTSRSVLTLRGVTTGTSAEGTSLVNIWFHFDWQLRSGESAPFDVVDVLELNANGLISKLHIVYDTVETRTTFEQETGRVSWRMSEQFT